MLPEEIFPYPSFRQGQKELSQSVYVSCKRGEKLVAEAMSGFGKTAAVLAGVISAATDDGLRVIYVCRTKRQVFRVLEELQRFSGRHPLRATSLFSKFDYCLLRQKAFGVAPETFKWYCSFQTSNNLCSYFLNVPFNRDKIEKLVDHHTKTPGPMTELLLRGNELHICPYEVARMSVARSDIIVTTYHYLLDQSSRSILISNDEPLGKMVGVIDEAHNVRDFLSGDSTTELAFSDIRACVDDSKNLYLADISSALAEICDKASRFCSQTESWFVDKPAFINAITGDHPKDWLSDLVFQLTTNSGVAWYSVATMRNLPVSIIKVGAFLSALLASVDLDVALAKSDSALFLIDTNPSLRFLRAIAGFRSIILLSATINPSALFLRSIGLDQNSTSVHTVSTAYKFRIRTVVDTSVTTRFKMRSSQMYSEIAKKVAAICSCTAGGVGVFLPSYAVLGAVAGPLRQTLERPGGNQSSRIVLVERPGLSNSESEEMMRAFKSNSGQVLFAVQGGRFSEGEDFPGDQMDASVVVGLPFPPPSPTMFAEYKQMERDRYDKHEAYLVLSLLPALRKAFQCAGRHVRDPGKVGMVFFLDSRFAAQNVVDLMPPWLREDMVVGNFPAESISTITRDFFSAAGRR